VGRYYIARRDPVGVDEAARRIVEVDDDAGTVTFADRATESLALAEIVVDRKALGADIVATPTGPAAPRSIGLDTEPWARLATLVDALTRLGLGPLRIVGEYPTVPVESLPRGATA
jgi:hypothetical protein